MGKLMKQAQEMQTRLAEAQDGLERITVTGEAGAGMVKAEVNAKGTLVSLSIDPSLMSADEKEVAEDLIVAAIRDGQEKAAERAQAEMGKITDGMGLPPGMKMPFS